MPLEARVRDKAAHGESVDEAVVEVLIGGGDLSRKRSGWNQLALAGRLGTLEGAAVYAEAVFAGGADEALRIDRAGKVDVQVGALGELRQKRAQRRRPGMH